MGRICVDTFDLTESETPVPMSQSLSTSNPKKNHDYGVLSKYSAISNNDYMKDLYSKELEYSNGKNTNRRQSSISSIYTNNGSMNYYSNPSSFDSHRNSFDFSSLYSMATNHPNNFTAMEDAVLEESDDGTDSNNSGICTIVMVDPFLSSGVYRRSNNLLPDDDDDQKLDDEEEDEEKVDGDEDEENEEDSFDENSTADIILEEDDDDDEQESDEDENEDDDEEEEFMATFETDSMNESTSNKASRNSKDTNPKKVYIYRCKSCYSDICHSSLIISKDFWGNKGEAYFVKNVLNIREDKQEVMKNMRTGQYGVKSIYCIQCDINIGWKYITSVSTHEKYKIGNFVIEKKLLDVYKVPN